MNSVPKAVPDRMRPSVGVLGSILVFVPGIWLGPGFSASCAVEPAGEDDDDAPQPLKKLEAFFTPALTPIPTPLAAPVLPEPVLFGEVGLLGTDLTLFALEPGSETVRDAMFAVSSVGEAVRSDEEGTRDIAGVWYASRPAG